MDSRNILVLSAITLFGFPCLGGVAVAQQASLKQPLVGAWVLVSHEVTAPDGKKTSDLGAKPNGTVIYDAGGQYSLVFTDADRPKWKSPNRNEATQDDIKSAFLGTIAQSGTWSVDADGKTVVHRVRTALNPNVEGREYKITAVIAGDELRVTENNPNGNTVQIVERLAK